jgi:hypothetical protein
MDSMLAFCGLACDSCPIHLATIEIDTDKQTLMRKDIADQLAKIYQTTPNPEIISDCDGCKIDNGKLFTGCINCEIRKCAKVRNLESCAFCNDYICKILSKHYTYDPESRNRLEIIRRNIAHSLL